MTRLTYRRGILGPAFFIALFSVQTQAASLPPFGDVAAQTPGVTASVPWTPPPTDPLAIRWMAGAPETGPNALQGQPPGEDREPMREGFHDYHLACDLNNDGTDDYASETPTRGSFGNVNTGRPTHGFPGQHWKASIDAYSGLDGSLLWNVDDLDYWDAGGLDYLSGRFFIEGYRRPLPFPPGWRPLPNFQTTSDLNGDSTCDAVVYGFKQYANGTQPGFLGCFFGCRQRHEIAAELRVLSGVSGYTIWNRTFEISTDATTTYNYPTGMLYHDTPSGPRVVFSTADYFNPLPCQDDEARGCPNDGPPRKDTLAMVTDHIFLFDASNGRELWNHTIDPLPFSVLHDSFNVTKIAGVGDVTGDGVPDVVLDQDVVYRRHDRCWRYYAHNGFSPVAANRCERAPPKFPGVFVLALDGATGRLLWNTPAVESGSVRSRSQSLEGEETCESLDAEFTRVINDTTGDGAADVLTLYYTWVEPCDARRDRGTSANGQFLIHVVPFDGKGGKKLWDVRVQGFGYGDSLTPPGGPAQPYIAVGSVDPATFVLPGARFPQKDVRMSVLRLKDGAMMASYRDQLAQDSYLSSFFALEQFYSTLAPYDWTADGVRDLVAPAHYVPPVGTQQELLSTAKQTFRVLDAKTGLPFRELVTWGSNGLVVACPGAERYLQVISGHSRRLDLVRLDVEEARIVWRQPVWFDPRLYPTTVGIDLTGLHAVCGEDRAARTFFATNIATFTFYRTRGLETFPEVGFTRPDGRLDWINPPLMTLFGVSPDTAILDQSSDGPSPPGLFGSTVAKAVGIGVVATLGVAGGFTIRRSGRDPLGRRRQLP